MKLGIFSHCAIDSISIGNSNYEQIGGAACYAGYTAKNLKFNVELFTKFGPDFPFEQYLTKKGISFNNALTKTPTTKFKISIEGVDRTLKLENVCDPIDYQKSDSDGILVSPIFNEVSFELFSKIKKDSKFLFLDPQGFLRRTDDKKNVFLEKTDIDLSKVSAIKVNPEEIEHIVGNSDVDSLKILQKKGVEYVLLTNKANVSLLYKDKLYSITLPNKKVYDTTGLGDIFSATFCCTMIKEKDFLWALCFAGGAAQAALDTGEVGLLKIPQKSAVETNASYFYNVVKFRQV